MDITSDKRESGSVSPIDYLGWTREAGNLTWLYSNCNVLLTRGAYRLTLMFIKKVDNSTLALKTFWIGSNECFREVPQTGF